MDLIREDYILGNKKIVVGDNLHDLVLENIGKIWVRYGNGYKEFSNFVSTLLKSTSDISRVIIEYNGVKSSDDYKDGLLIFDVSKKNLYLKYKDSLLLLLEYNDGVNEKYVSKGGDTMNGALKIEVKSGSPLYVNSSNLVQNLNANYLEGHEAKDFVQKDNDEEITGNWTFEGNNIHNGLNVFNNDVTINGPLEENSTAKFKGKTYFKNEIEVDKTATFKQSAGAAIRVGNGDIITDGSIGSSQFMSGMTGYGWRIDASTNTLTIDNLIVRGVLNVFELVVNKISATNGSFWITDSFKIDKVHNILLIDIDNNPVTNEAQYHELMNMFNEDDYYIIYSSTFNKTTFTPTNPHPFALRNNPDPVVDTNSFDTFRYIFKINKLNEFKDLFQLQNTSVTQQTVIISFEDYLEKLASLGAIIKRREDAIIITNMSSSYIIEPNKYITFESGNRSGCFYIDDNKIALISDDDLGNEILINPVLLTDTESIRIEVLLDIENTTYSYYGLDIINSEQNLHTLYTNYIIDLYNIFLKDPTDTSELLLIGDNFILPYDLKNFIDLTYTVIPSNNVELYEDKYIFDYNSIARINLYGKYFGSTVDLDMRLYIIEANHNEYPVFKPGDILKCQKFVGNNIKQYHALVLGLIGDYSYIILLQNNNILSEGTTLEYNSDGALTESNVNLDTTLYDRSLGIAKDLQDYYMLANNILTKYSENKNSLTSDAVHWAVLVLIAPSDVDYYEELLPNNPDLNQIYSWVNTIFENQVEYTSYDEYLEHPIFKKAFLESTISSPVKNDSLVRIGSILFGDRRNSMYLTSSEQNSPYTDVLVGVNRPDYTVIYITPKYVRFEGSLNFDGVLRKGNYYCQDEDFALIMDSGDNSLDSLNESQRTFYDKYRPFSLKVQRPLEEGLATDVRNVNLTYVGTEDTVYVNGQPLKLLVNGVDYFVSTNLNDTILDTTFTEQQIGRATITRDLLQITLFIGENG